jgi:hypothetical protein
MRLVEMMPNTSTVLSRDSQTVWEIVVPLNHCMQPTPQPVIKFAYANLPPVRCAADAGC